jgi:hypothetical protein
MEKEQEQPEFLNQHPTQGLSIHDKFMLLRVKYIRAVEKSNNRKRSLRHLNKLHADTRFAILGLRSELREARETADGALSVNEALRNRIDELQTKLTAATAHV